jgi:hypothetical protein
MRPTVTEQLDSLRHVLAEIVAPEVASPYAAEILGGVIAALDALKNSWAAVPEFLLWDIQATAGVLQASRPLLDEALAAEVDRAVADAPDAAPDWPALERHQEVLRGLLVRAQPAILANSESAWPDQTSAYALMVRHMRERAERYPFAITARLPAPKPA